MENVSGMKPSMIITLLTMLDIEKSGFEQDGVDNYYLQKAKETGKPLGFLESVETQIDMLVTMGEGYENDFVKYSLYDMENTESDLVPIVSGWRVGDALSTEQSITEMRDQWPALYQSLMLDRNEAWLPQIEEYLSSGKAPFIIVGLAHLHGPDGLLRRLADSGCLVKKLVYR
jgi:uncharacterized protein YbaP (TraB family)